MKRIDQYKFILGSESIVGKVVEKHSEAKGNIILTQRVYPGILFQIRNAKAILLDNVNEIGHSINLAKQIEIPCVLLKEKSSFKNGDLIKIDFRRKNITKLQ